MFGLKRLTLVLEHLYLGAQKMAATNADLTNATTALTTAMEANTAATNAAVAAGIGVPAVDLQPAVDAVTAANSALEANTAALTAATPAPAPPA